MYNGNILTMIRTIIVELAGREREMGIRSLF
jgi:hypothetical protein